MRILKTFQIFLPCVFFGGTAPNTQQVPHNMPEKHLVNACVDVVLTVATKACLGNICYLPKNSIKTILSCGNSECARGMLRFMIFTIQVASYTPTLLAYFKIITLPFSPVVSILILSSINSIPILIPTIISLFKGDMAMFCFGLIQLVLSVFLPLTDLVRGLGLVYGILLDLVISLCLFYLSSAAFIMLKVKIDPSAGSVLSICIVPKFLCGAAYNPIYMFGYLMELCRLSILSSPFYAFGFVIEFIYANIIPACYILSPLLFVLDLFDYDYELLSGLSCLSVL